MVYIQPRHIRLLLSAVCFMIAALCSLPRVTHAQTGSYQFLPMPDLWYNSVDGVRVGVRLRGETAGSFGDGPHRLKLGAWLGSKFPANPFSYYVTFTEPIPAISDFGSEGSIRLRSSVRTGFQRHGITFHKRWQPGFDEFNYKELELGLRAEERFNSDYLLYPRLWQEEWLYITHADFSWHDENGMGRYRLNVSADANVPGSHEGFIRGQLEFLQQVPLGHLFELRMRIFGAAAGRETAPEYRYMRSTAPAADWMKHGLTRARGTIPPGWFDSGAIQIADGSSLRGYVNRDISILTGSPGDAPLYLSSASSNIELDYPNPLDPALRNISLFGEFIRLQSYLFYDGGVAGGGDFAAGEEEFISDAGLGFLFSFNIPDHLGKRSGFSLRYDIPLWLSHPGDEKSLKFRNILGIGAVIAF